MSCQARIDAELVCDSQGCETAEALRVDLAFAKSQRDDNENAWQTEKAKRLLIKRAGSSAMTDEELLGLLDDERQKFTRSNEELMRTLTDELIARKVYPTHWPGPDAHERVRGWGARWHLYREPLHCPHCNADLRDQTWGPPGKREIGHSSRVLDRTTHFSCPDCGKGWPR